MVTYTALTTLPDQGQAEALGEAMERLEPAPTGVGVFKVEDGSGLFEVGGYFIEPPDAAGLALLASMHGAADFAVSELPETDWVAHVRRELAPVEAGRFFVYGSHDADKVPEGRISLLIEAAMAFGTGHHGTTLGCLRALDVLLDSESAIPSAQSEVFLGVPAELLRRRPDHLPVGAPAPGRRPSTRAASSSSRMVPSRGSSPISTRTTCVVRSIPIRS